MSYKKYNNVSFDKNNSSGPRNAFKLDAVYNRIFPNKSVYHDFQYGKKAYYGRIDGKNNVVNVNESFLKNINTPDGNPIMCLNFVADAFNEMRRYIKIEAVRKLTPDTFINPEWDAKKAWSSPHIFYDQNIRNIYEVFVRAALLADGKESKIYNIDDFISVFFNDFYANIDQAIPLTKTGMIMSKFYNPTSTGLCIETLNQDFSKVEETFGKIIRSTNFEFYLLAAAKFGFLVDKNAPWRLIANLNSPRMQKYMSMYGVSVDNVFDTCFIPTYRVDIENLKIYIQQLYDAYSSSFPTNLKENEIYANSPCPPYKQPKFIEVPRQKISFAEYQTEYNDLFWLKLYYRIKLKESKVPTPDSMLQREMLKLEELYKKLDFDRSLEYINDRIKKQMIWF
jgi:hypothetical protein